MIVIYHTNSKVQEVFDFSNNCLLPFVSINITVLLFELSKKYPEKLILWCKYSLKNELNYSKLTSIFHHKRVLSSFSVSGSYIISDNIQFIDNTFLSKPNREVSFPTYLMSSDVGGIYASIINALADQVYPIDNFDYFLCSLAKSSMSLGLICNSNPDLLLNHEEELRHCKPKLNLDFKFVSQHWKKKWVFILFLNLLITENKVFIYSLIKSLFIPRVNLKRQSLNEVVFNSSIKKKGTDEFDVIIPTIGRKSCLHDVLVDLSLQTILPKKVVIVEQNPISTEVSELDYLTTEIFPFEVEHIFTHRTGACHARNLALKRIRSPWIFLADDDIRIKESFFETLLQSISSTGYSAFCISCLRSGEIKSSEIINQSIFFGSGCSIISKEIAKNVSFDLSFEFGYGEDVDFGMQIRNLGYDVLYLPHPEILHLKAPIGGFRIERKMDWENGDIVPKPSPTLMLLNLNHSTLKQLAGYKLLLLLSYYSKQRIKNPFSYRKHFNKQWELSIYWAKELKKVK